MRDVTLCPEWEEALQGFVLLGFDPPTPAPAKTFWIEASGTADGTEIAVYDSLEEAEKGEKPLSKMPVVMTAEGFPHRVELPDGSQVGYKLPKAFPLGARRIWVSDAPVVEPDAE
jgi:hypothetical protein